MKTLSTITLLLCLTVSTWANRHLIDLNPQWLNQTDIDVHSIDFIPRNHTDLIQKHLLLVEQTLRARSTEHLTPSQQANRLRCLDILHEYAMARTFPQNNSYTYLTPIFIDDDQVHCAVGHLMKETGYGSIAQELDAQNELVLVQQIKNPKAVKWMHDYGLSLEECAWIQPGYPNSYIIEQKVLDLSGLSPLTPIVNRLIDADQALYFNATLTNVGTVLPSVPDADGNIWLHYDTQGAKSIINLNFNKSGTRLISKIKGWGLDTSVPGGTGGNIFSYPPFSPNIVIENAQIQNWAASTDSFYDDYDNVLTEFLPNFASYISPPLTLSPDFPLNNFGTDSMSYQSWLMSAVSNYQGTSALANYQLYVDPSASNRRGGIQLQLLVIPNDSLGIFSISIHEVQLNLSSEKEGVEIVWVDHLNLDINSYTIEHSTDAGRWEALTTLDQSQNTNGTYQYVDREPAEGMNYYRLRIRSNNGNEKHTAIHSINYKAPMATTYAGIEIVGANQVTDELSIVYSDRFTNSEIEVFDANGHRVSVPTTRETNTAVLHTSGLSVGQYFVRMEGQFVRFMKK